MQNAAGGGTSAATEDLHCAIVSDLTSLIAHVQASMELIESAIAGEAPLGYQEIGSNVVVLDDVTPRYASGRAALKSCEAHLGAALRFLQDTRTPQRPALIPCPAENRFTLAEASPCGRLAR